MIFYFKLSPTYVMIDIVYFHKLYKGKLFIKKKKRMGIGETIHYNNDIIVYVDNKCA